MIENFGDFLGGKTVGFCNNKNSIIDTTIIGTILHVHIKQKNKQQLY